jgi:ParB family chromosome partitioning protein
MDEVRDVAIESIKIKKRVRKDFGDLVPLMNSLKKYGQMNPIVLNSRYELIAGFRRLQALKRLGWTTVRATIVDRNTELEMLELELEENIQRRDLSADEISDGFDRMSRLKNPGCILKIFKGIPRFFGKNS